MVVPNSLENTETFKPTALEFLPHKECLQCFSIQGQIRYIQASPLVCFGNEPFPSVSPTAKAPHRRRVSGEAKHGWSLAMCKDYLTVGVVVIRKWLGLEGRAGLAPRDGAGANAFSALKVFMSCATRPRPAQVGTPPTGPASFQDTSAA